MFVPTVGKLKGMRDESTKPTYGCQVTIQSEQEKQMMKIYRKEEKKERKRERRGDEGDTFEYAFHFDPRELRLQREQALLTARSSPVLGRHRDYERIRYPHVYDCYAEATKTSAFVGGAKMLLPEGIRRENNKMYEEVEIPPNEPMPVGFEEKPVYISELDEWKSRHRLKLRLLVAATSVKHNNCSEGAFKSRRGQTTALMETKIRLTCPLSPT
ncbi:Activating signal cointegrator 1 complex subunit 3 [Labeo rohita]|uniref:Activating signal cointegrator 1 complex subunit 3 n=1 Tax=Labeo rohita TaxID=84645 RepID=A0ABQ8LYJ1_LABRO|nr:Activating signal cointegrator 1 complex subunit 3 [Labeo rohita]